MKKLIFYFVFLTSWFSFSQLNRQMISSLGSTSKTNKGIIVTQSVGQQSITGNYISSRLNKISQGYQKPNFDLTILNSNISELDISLFPNPSDRIVNIKYNTDADINLSIFDPTGKLVFKNILPGSKLNKTIDLNNLSSGTYMVRIQSNQLNYFTKLIIKR